MNMLLIVHILITVIMRYWIVIINIRWITNGLIDWLLILKEIFINSIGEIDFPFIWIILDLGKKLG